MRPARQAGGLMSHTAESLCCTLIQFPAPQSRSRCRAVSTELLGDSQQSRKWGIFALRLEFASRYSWCGLQQGRHSTANCGARMW